MVMDRRLNIVWMSVLPNLIFKFTVILKKIKKKQKRKLPCQYRQTYSKVYMERQETQNSQFGIEKN